MVYAHAEQQEICAAMQGRGALAQRVREMLRLSGFVLLPAVDVDADRIGHGLLWQVAVFAQGEGGCYLSIDPVVIDSNTGGSFNRYAYAANNPYKYVDPDGRNHALAARLTYKISFEVATALGAAKLGSVIGIGLYDLLHETANPLQSKRRDDPPSAGHAGDRQDSKRDNNRNSDGEKPAPDKTAKDMENRLEKISARMPRKNFTI